MDRFKGRRNAAEEPEQPASGQEHEVPPTDAGSQVSEQEPTDKTGEWFSAGPDQPPPVTGIAGSISPLTHSTLLQNSGEAQGSDVDDSPAKQQPRTPTPVGDERLDALMDQARKGHSSKDLEALWDALMSVPRWHILQRVKGEKTEPHAIESPIGPVLMVFTSKARAEAAASTKAMRNMPFAWKIASTTTGDALDWILRQRDGGVRGIEVNRGVEPGITSALQLLPERYVRVWGRSLDASAEVSPDFEPLALRLGLDPSQENLDELHRAFFGLQIWFGLRDAKRPNQPAFVPVDGKPALMLFTSRSEAQTGAASVGRERDWPTDMMTIEPTKLVGWMQTLPGLGAPRAVVNRAGTPFLIDLEQVGLLWERYGG